MVPLVIATGGQRILWAVSIATFGLSYGTIAYYTLMTAAGDQGQWPNTLVHLQFFGAGAIIALSLRGRIPSIPGWSRLLCVALAVTCWFIAIQVCGVKSWDPHPTLPGALAGWMLILAGAMLFFFALFGLAAHRIPSMIAYLGRISFGLYVFHSLMLLFTFEHILRTLGVARNNWMSDLLGTSIALTLTVAAATLSFTCFEKPILSLKRRFTYVAAREES